MSRWRRKVCKDVVETRLSGSAFQILAAATGKGRLPTEDRQPQQHSRNWVRDFRMMWAQWNRGETGETGGHECKARNFPKADQHISRYTHRKFTSIKWMLAKSLLYRNFNCDICEHTLRNNYATGLHPKSSSVLGLVGYAQGPTMVPAGPEAWKRLPASRKTFAILILF